jgi:hypothetical protein
VFPVLSLFAQNQTEIEPSVLWLPLAASVTVAVALYALFLLATRNATKAGVTTSAVVVAVFYYGLIAEHPPRLLVVVWPALFLAAAVAALRTRRDLGALVLVLGVAAGVRSLPSVVSTTVFAIRHAGISASDSRLWPTPLAVPTVTAGANLPDIYVVIPDDYARTDILRQYIKYDDTAFVQQLQQRGFVVSPQGRSPYSDSESNIASLLNMDYLSTFPRVLGPDSQDVRPVKRVIEDNRASRLLAAIGYDYVHIDTDEVTFAGGNPAISPFAPPDSFASLWLQKSILRLVGGPIGFDQSARNARFRTSISTGFAELGAVPAHSRPRFVVFHTLLPHDPYLYDEQGRSVTFPVHSDEDLASAAGRVAYVKQLEFLHRRLLDALDHILARSTTPPVIVLQSDEGFQANTEPFGEAAMQDIRVKGLGAFYLPGAAAGGLPDPPNAVNDLRFVFNQYLGTHYKLLRSVSYSEGDRPYDFTELRVR